MPTLEKTIDHFLVDRELKGNTERTILNYKQFLSYFTDYIGPDYLAEDITLENLTGYQLYLSRKEKFENHTFKIQKGGKLDKITIQSYIRHLRVFVKFLYEEGYLEEELTLKFKLPKSPRKTISILDDEEINILYDSFKETSEIQLRNKCIISLLLDCGLRRNEVITIDYTNIFWSNNYIKIVGKGNNERIVPLGLITKKLLLKYINKRSIPLEASTRLFIDKNKAPLSETAFRMMFRRLKDKTGIERLHPHLLRHTFATHYLVNGGDIFALQLILGHTSLDMVRKYSHLASGYIISNHKKISPLDNSQNKRKV